MGKTKSSKAKKYLGASIWAVIILLLLAAELCLFLWLFQICLGSVVLMAFAGIAAAIILVAIIAIVFVLIQRIKEIKKGEEEDAVSQY